MTQPVLLDCDTGIDDSFALLYVHAHQHVNLVALISTAGNVPLEMVHKNNRNWLSLLNNHATPVHVGAAEPLSAKQMWADEAHEASGLGFATLPEAPLSGDNPISGAQAWVNLSQQYNGELIGVITGPATTFAEALTIDPTFPLRLKKLVLMGGAFNFPGNTSPVSEWNVAWDPEAWAQVITAQHAHLPIICPLNVTETVEFKPEHLQEICRTAQEPLEELFHGCDLGQRSSHINPIIRALSDELRFYFNFHYEDRGTYMAHMHDPFAAFIAIQEQPSTYQDCYIAVELDGTLTRGQTIADPRAIWGKPPNARIITSTRVDEFLHHYTHTIGNYLLHTKAEGA